MKNFYLSLLVLCSFCIFSCQKQISDTIPPAFVDSLDTVPIPTAILLKKYIRIDPALSAPRDTVDVAEYHYDALNRVDVIQYRSNYSTDPDYSGIERRYYTGNDTLIAWRKIVSFEQGATAPDSLEEYLFYNADRKLVRDSVIDNGSEVLYLFRYDGNKVYSLFTYSSVNPDTLAYTHHTLTRAGANITAQKDTAYYYTGGIPPASGDYNHEETVFTYDTHPNPFYRMSLHLPAIFETEDAAHNDFETMQSNNYLKVFSSFSSWGSPSDNTYSYTYLPNGYPATSVIIDATEGTTYNGIFIYY